MSFGYEFYTIKDIRYQQKKAVCSAVPFYISFLRVIQPWESDQDELDIVSMSNLWLSISIAVSWQHRNKMNQVIFVTFSLVAFSPLLASNTSY